MEAKKMKIRVVLATPVQVWSLDVDYLIPKVAEYVFYVPSMNIKFAQDPRAGNSLNNIIEVHF